MERTRKDHLCTAVQRNSFLSMKNSKATMRHLVVFSYIKVNFPVILKTIISAFLSKTRKEKFNFRFISISLIFPMTKNPFNRLSNFKSYFVTVLELA